MAATRKPAPKKRAPGVDGSPLSPQTPLSPLSGVWSGDPPSEKSLVVDQQPTDRQPPFAFSQCEIVDSALCVNHRPGHVGTRPHLAHLSSWLAFRGVIGVRSLFRGYGIPACQSVAEEIDELEAGGNDWREGVRKPGALLHWMIKERCDGN